jgi:hypothetical protein
MEGDEGKVSLLERPGSGDPAVVEALMEDYASRVYRPRMALREMLTQPLGPRA